MSHTHHIHHRHLLVRQYSKTVGNTPVFSNNYNNNNITNGQGNATTAYVNGNKVNSGIDPMNIKLNEHDEIAIVYGKAPSNIPSRYSFSQGT